MRLMYLTPDVREGLFFDEGGFPKGEAGWQEIELADWVPDSAFCLWVRGPHFLPLYRDGDKLIIGPGEPQRRGDRILAKIRGREVGPFTLVGRSPREFKVEHPGDGRAETLSAADVEWAVKILWASQ